MRTLRLDVPMVFGATIVFGAALACSQAQTGSPQEGAQRFMEFCAGCHGADGRGGDKAPALVPVSRAAPLSDAELFRIVHDGTREGMPPFAQIGDAKIRAVVSYLRALQGEAEPDGSSAKALVPGNAEAGRALFFGKAQCSPCHMIDGDGGFMARDLTGYARGRTPDTIRSAIINPDSPLASSSRVVSVTTKTGEKLTGVLRNEDNFTLELQTEDGRYHSLERNDLTEIHYSDHSLMPRDYAQRLAPKELDDIVSFLIESSAKLRNPGISDR